MPVVKNFITADEMREENDLDFPEMVDGKAIIDAKIAKNDEQDSIQSDRDNASIMVRELAIREREANKQALQDQIKRNNNIPVNESGELERLRTKYSFNVGDRPVNIEIGGLAPKNRKGDQNIKLESGRIDALNDSLFFND